MLSMNKKDKIIEIAADLIHEYGYNNIGLKRILDEAQIPKGSFYYYFDSKEDLALNVIDYHIQITKKILDQFEKNVDGLKGFFNFYFEKFYELGYKRGCAIGNLIMELSDLRESFRLKLLKWSMMLESEIYEMLQNSNLDENIDKKSMSSFLVSCFEGVLLKTKVEKDSKAIKEFDYYVFKILLKNRGGNNMTAKEKILEVVKNHNLMNISTVDENGMPKARGVDYAMGEDESVLYFITHKTTSKVKEIQANNNVFIVIDHDCDSMEELGQLRYIKATGKAYISETPEQAQKAFGLILQKFPYLKDLPGEPSDFVGVRVELEKVMLTDNTVHFGHTEEVAYR